MQFVWHSAGCTGSLCTFAAVHAGGIDFIMPWHAWQSMRPYIISLRNPAINLSCQVSLLVAFALLLCIMRPCTRVVTCV
jgi:hypothetical protein